MGLPVRIESACFSSGKLINTILRRVGPGKHFNWEPVQPMFVPASNLGVLLFRSQAYTARYHYLGVRCFPGKGIDRPLGPMVDFPGSPISRKRKGTCFEACADTDALPVSLWDCLGIILVAPPRSTAVFILLFKVFFIFILFLITSMQYRRK